MTDPPSTMLLHLNTTMLAETHMAEVSLQYREEVASNTVSGFWYLLIPVAAVGLALLIYKIVSRPPPIVNTPQGMLHELCRVHRLGAAKQRLLEQIAEEAELQQPATMLLGVTQFETAVEKARPHMRYNRRQQAALGVLRRKLFT